MHLCGLIILLTVTQAVGVATHGWRGDGSGRYPQAAPPSEWSLETNIAWETALPGPGYGSPILLSDRLFVVAQPAELLCLSRDGRILWQQGHSYVDALGQARFDAIKEERLAARDRKIEISRLKYQRERMADEKPRPEAKMQELAVTISKLQAREEALRPRHHVLKDWQRRLYTGERWQDCLRQLRYWHRLRP